MLVASVPCFLPLLLLSYLWYPGEGAGGVLGPPVITYGPPTPPHGARLLSPLRDPSDMRFPQGNIAMFTKSPKNKDYGSTFSRVFIAMFTPEVRFPQGNIAISPFKSH